MSQPTLNTHAIDAQVDACWFLVRNEGRQIRCGLPATHRYPSHGPGGWFQVCSLHARVANENCNGKLHISKIHNPHP